MDKPGARGNLVRWEKHRQKNELQKDRERISVLNCLPKFQTLMSEL